MISGLGLLVLYDLRPAVTHIKHRHTRRRRRHTHSTLDAARLHVNLANVHTTTNNASVGFIIILHHRVFYPLTAHRRTWAADGECIVKNLMSQWMIASLQNWDQTCQIRKNKYQASDKQRMLSAGYHCCQCKSVKELLDTSWRCKIHLVTSNPTPQHPLTVNLTERLPQKPFPFYQSFINRSMPINTNEH